MNGKIEGKRSDFYEQYRRARFLCSAKALYSIYGNVVDPGGVMLLDGLEKVLCPKVYYSIMNKHKNTIYPIADYKWAVKSNHLF